MEDATVTNNDKLNYNQEFPAVVDTDDLVFELGKQQVDIINKEKLLKGIVQKNNELIASIASLKKSNEQYKNELNAIKNSYPQKEEQFRKTEEGHRNSIRLYAIKNEDLNKEISSLRQELKSTFEDNKVKDQKIENLLSEINALKEEIKSNSSKKRKTRSKRKSK